MIRRFSSEQGLSLIEMMVSVLIFMLLAGAAFGLLIATQGQQKTESQLLDSFQSARMSMDQIVRDVSDAGYPPPSFFTGTPPATKFAKTPFAWSPGYLPNSPCTVGGSCSTPGPYDLIIETDVDPQNPVPDGVEWVRYRLEGTTLLRGVFSKTAGVDPDSGTLDPTALVPYVENVVNNPVAAQLAQLQTAYPAMFTSGAVPVFTYTFNPPTVPFNPQNIIEVNITLIVMAREVDAKTGQPRIAELNGRARRLNPNK